MRVYTDSIGDTMFRKRVKIPIKILLKTHFGIVLPKIVYILVVSVCF